jgi:cytochrome P450
MTRANVAQEHVTQVAQRVLDIYRSKHSKEDSLQRMDYIIDRIVAHSYPSDKHRLGEIMTFILAGHETSTNTLTFLLYELARNPQKQKKLQQELDEYITPETCPDGHPSLNQVTKMEYLNNCLRESMRLWPTASAAGRTVVNDIEYEGMVIPKGRFVQLNFYSMFRQPWINKPDEFIPERWSDQSDPQQLNDLKEMFMPFALGHRNCIGQNMAMLQLRILSANFFKYYEFELAHPEDVKLEVALLMKIERLEMRVRKRIL